MTPGVVASALGRIGRNR
ncbi:hypothetical protein E2C01_097194 [Portunus trituberculatus]|uniref:Uncharacterized protein n=1 Tax=Portunus trituberculatus TaxID=210409 RepID=A0A5B7K541_PORTR|nr:hypothetical protein [Portunus trituberculatus]